MNKHNRRLVMGAVIGAMVGIMAAKMVEQSIEEAEAQGKKARLKKNPTDWLKLGAAIIGALRQLAALFA